MGEGEKRPTVVSLFTGAMGLDLGFELEGFDVRVALDKDANVVENLKRNHPNIPVIGKDIFDVSTGELLGTAGLKVGEATVVAGGPPCQSFSTAGKRLSINERRGQALFEYLRVVREAQPRFFVFENVAGLLSAALKHVSFYERIEKKEEELAPEERLGSVFEKILAEFERITSSDGGHYTISWGVLNAADYGAAQKRRRLIIIGSRDGEKVTLPPATHAPPDSLEVKMGYKKRWVTVRDILKDLNDPNPEYLPYPRWGKYMKHIPPGGCWRDLPEEVKKEAMGGAYYSQGGRTGFYRRLSWDEPAPTLVTSPVFKGSVLAHPEQDRPVSVKEYARFQGLPDSLKFVGKTAAKYRIIGDAVPLPLSRAIAKQILKVLKRELSLEAGEALESIPE
jgi:DNA (cytosine-5)-methyltransferase 1